MVTNTEVKTVLRMTAKLLLVGVAVVLVAALPQTAGPEAVGEEGGPSMVDFSGVTERPKQVEACRAAAEVLLGGLESNRNALEKPERWRTPYRPPGIKSWQDLKFDEPLVPFEEMSYEEKLLIWGFPSGMQPAVTMMPRMLTMIAYGEYAIRGVTTPDLLLIRNAPVWDMPRLEEYLARLISPVTEKLIEVNHKDFSPGNAYVRVITEDEVEELVALDASVDEWWKYSVLSFGKNEQKDIRISLTGKEKLVQPTVTGGKHYPFIVYLRIYGLNGVLTEGLY